MRIDSRDISVIVQGHVKGLAGEPEDRRWTYQALVAVRRHLPMAELILSTFQGCDVSGLPYDVLVLSNDPGYTDLGAFNRMVGNTNRQIVSSRAGLSRATRRYALKMRYDLVLEGNRFLDYFGVFNERMDQWRLFRNRLVSCTSISFNPWKYFTTPLAPSDWFHFGFREDVLDLWSIPLIPQPELRVPADGAKPAPVYGQAHRYSAEQYIWVSFLRKHGTVHFQHANDIDNGSRELTDTTIVNNLVLLEPDQIPLRCLKYDDRNMLTYSKQITYSHAEWLDLYGRLCLVGYDPAPVQGLALHTVSPVFGGNGTECPAPTPRLVEILKELARLAPEISFRSLSLPQGEPWVKRLTRFPGECFRLLAALVKILRPRVVMEFGREGGLSTLAMKAFLTRPYLLASMPHDFRPGLAALCPLVPEHLITSDEILTVDQDISLPANLEKILPCVKNAELVVFHFRDGRLISEILNRIPPESCRKGVMVLLSGIRSWSVAPVWETLERPKIDLTSLGSPEGVGLVDWTASNGIGLP